MRPSRWPLQRRGDRYGRQPSNGNSSSTSLRFFDLKGLREEIEQLHFRDFMRMLGPVIPFRFSGVRPVSKPSNRDPSVDDRRKSQSSFGASFRELSGSLRWRAFRTNPALGDQGLRIWSFFCLFRTLPHVRCAYYRDATCDLRIGVEIPRRGKIGIHAHNLLERLCQRHVKIRPRNTIQCQRALGMPSAVFSVQSNPRS